MSKKNEDPWYKQCTYELPMGDGSFVHGTSWLPEEHAKVGHWIKLKKHHLYPDRSWRVTFVGSRCRESFLVKHEMNHKHQRKMSDI